MELVLGILIGVLVTVFYFCNPWVAKGTLKIDHSNPTKDVYRFEIKDLDRLNKAKRVRMNIDHNADLSQK